jgi:hypothetical protein
MKRTKHTYEKVKEMFDLQSCLLLTTQEEYNKIIYSSKFVKYKYTAKCGHEHEVFYHVFLNRGTGILCPSCVIKSNAKKMKEIVSVDKLKNIKLELKCIDYFKNLVKNNFLVVKAFDGCKADVIIKPLNVIEDEWVGIQFKTTLKATRDYGFHIKNDYPNCIIICMCWEDKKMWIFKNDDVKYISKISIGLNNSKYDKYEVNDINKKISTIYKITEKISFDKLDTPINIYQQREKEYYKYRESKINFLIFKYHDIEGMVYDYCINNKKIQEKVGCVDKYRLGRFIFGLCKNNGKDSIMQYNKGDNDFYWLHCDNKRYFFVIPESILIQKNYIGNNFKKYQIKLNPFTPRKTSWTLPYLFDYENLDKDRLINLLK